MTVRGIPGIIAVGLGIVLGTCSARAQTTDQASAEALGETLRSLQERATPARPGSAAPIPDLDPRIGALADSPELTRELYDLAGEILTELSDRTGGDPEKMRQAVARGRADPAAFAASLSPAAQERLRALARKLSTESP
ncbi:MAG TPA: hypothetical protein VKW76_02235 [Candidatus Binatia bacterium]|nr:hypothetical protein [Candidatus Binatia bacterium]